MLKWCSKQRLKITKLVCMEDILQLTRNQPNASMQTAI